MKCYTHDSRPMLIVDLFDRPISEALSTAELAVFSVLSLDDPVHFLNSRNWEAGLLALSAGTVEIDGETFEVHRRDMLYLPATRQAAMRGKFLVFQTPGTEVYPVRHVQFAESFREELGEYQYCTRRDLYKLLGLNIQANTLMAGLTHVMPGNHQSRPDHRHPMQECYFFFDLDPNTMCAQFAYLAEDVRTPTAFHAREDQLVYVPGNWLHPGTFIGGGGWFCWIMAVTGERSFDGYTEMFTPNLLFKNLPV